MENIEQKLWDYIDGFTSEQETNDIAYLIANDSKIKNMYLQMLEYHQDLTQNLEIDEPSMSFVNNVMNHIRINEQPLVSSVNVNKKLIFGIFSMFLISLIVLLLFSNSILELEILKNSTYLPRTSPIKLDSFDTNYLYAFYALDILSVLLLIDKYLRFKLSKE